MNNIFKNILIGLAAIRANLTRVILTSLGLTIGIFTVSIVTAGVSSIDREFDKSMEYYGNDIQRDNQLMANNKKVQEWWTVCGPCQIPDPSRKKGEWWSVMEEVFHHE